MRGLIGVLCWLFLWSWSDCLIDQGSIKGVVEVAPTGAGSPTGRGDLTFLVAFAYGELPTGETLPRNAPPPRKGLPYLAHIRGDYLNNNLCRLDAIEGIELHPFRRYGWEGRILIDRENKITIGVTTQANLQVIKLTSQASLVCWPTIRPTMISIQQKAGVPALSSRNSCFLFSSLGRLITLTHICLCNAAEETQSFLLTMLSFSKMPPA